MNITKVLIEFIITFVVVYLFYYIFVIRKCKKNKNVVPVEVNLILSFYKIDSKKVSLYNMTKVVSLVSSLIIAMIVTIIGAFFDNTIILLIFGTLMSVLLAIIIYRFIGKYYEKKSQGTIKNKNK